MPLTVADVRVRLAEARRADDEIKAQITAELETVAAVIGDVTAVGPAAGSAGCRSFALEPVDPSGDISMSASVRADQHGRPVLALDSLTTTPGRGDGTRILDTVIRIARICDVDAVTAVCQSAGYWTPRTGTPIAGSQFFARRGFALDGDEATLAFREAMLALVIDPADAAAITGCTSPGALIAEHPHLWDALGNVTWAGRLPVR